MVLGRVCLKSTHLHLSHRVTYKNYKLSVTLRHIASAQFKLLMSFNRQLAPANKKNCSCPCLPKCCPRNQTLDSGPYHGLQCKPWNGGDELALPDVPLAGDHRHHAMVSCQQNERTQYFRAKPKPLLIHVWLLVGKVTAGVSCIPELTSMQICTSKSTMGEINRGGHLNLGPKLRSGFSNLPTHPDTSGQVEMAIPIF